LTQFEFAVHLCGDAVGSAEASVHSLTSAQKKPVPQ
jgi:hypothetical protein